MAEGALAPAGTPPSVGDGVPSLGTTRWIGFQTIVIREYSRIIRIWGQTLVPSAVTGGNWRSAFTGW